MEDHNVVNSVVKTAEACNFSHYGNQDSPWYHD